jgi:PKD repeat protein
VQFAVTASDEDAGDTLTYSRDFGDGSAASTTEDPSHTYTTAGTFNAKVTVSDGEASVTRTIPVTVFGADDTSKRFRVLVFSKTTGFRHDSIPAGIAAIKQLGTQNNFQVDASEDATLFRDNVLSHYDAVIWLSTTGDPLNDTQQAAFERYIRAGGGYAGIHAAADTEYTWTWYGKLVGAYFRNHPAGTPSATVKIDDTDHHSTLGLPNPWPRVDEWYNYQAPEGAVVGGGGTDYSPRAGGVHVLATVDESTYEEDDGNTTDDDHPISWCQRYDGGRSWYTGMGHTQASFAEADYLKHLLGGIEVAAGAVQDADCGSTGGNHAPTVSALRNPSGDVSPGDPVAFTAMGTDQDGDTLTYAWDFGDGGTATTKDAMHTYNEIGVFYAKVTVSDGKGGKDSALLKVVVQPVSDNEVEVGVGGVVPGVLSLSITGSANFGAFTPGVTRDYLASLAATATSSATAAELTVRDPNSQSTGHLVNGSRALEQPVQVRATDQANPDSAYAPVPENGARLRLLAFSSPFTGRPLTIGFKQSIAATESLVTGGYGKTLVFTLSPTTP